MATVVNKYKSYLAMLENSVGTRMFRNLFVEQGGEEKDVFRDGELSCASFVTSVLKLHDLIDDTHATVKRTVDELKPSGWEKIDKPRPGAVVVWRGREYDDGEVHEHIGFVLNSDEAVSTSTRKREVVRHPIGELDGPREVDAFYWHPALDNAESEELIADFTEIDPKGVPVSDIINALEDDEQPHRRL